ncbi:unnamed protein product, partial [Mesorhabditis spiculigera]
METVSTASPKRNASSGDPGSNDANMNSKPGTTVKSLAVTGVEPDSPPKTLLNKRNKDGRGRKSFKIDLPDGVSELKGKRNKVTGYYVEPGTSKMASEPNSPQRRSPQKNGATNDMLRKRVVSSKLRDYEELLKTERKSMPSKPHAVVRIPGKRGRPKKVREDTEEPEEDANAESSTNDLKPVVKYIRLHKRPMYNPNAFKVKRLLASIVKKGNKIPARRGRPPKLRDPVFVSIPETAPRSTTPMKTEMKPELDNGSHSPSRRSVLGAGRTNLGDPHLDVDLGTPKQEISAPSSSTSPDRARSTSPATSYGSFEDIFASQKSVDLPVIVPVPIPTPAPRKRGRPPKADKARKRPKREPKDRSLLVADSPSSGSATEEPAETSSQFMTKRSTQEPRPIVDIELPEFDWRGPREDQYADKDSQLCIDPRDFQQTVRPLPEFKLKRGFAQNAILDAEEDKRQARRQKMEKERSAQEAMAALQKGMADAFEEYTHHCQAIGISSQARRRRMVLQPLIT